MASSRITIKGQVTIPKNVRQHMGLRPGDEVEFRETKGRVELRKRVRKSPFARYQGHLKHLKGKNPDTVIQEMRGR